MSIDHVAPIIASGIATMIVIGCRKDLNAGMSEK